MKTRIAATIVLTLMTAPAFAAQRLAWAAACEKMNMETPHPFGELAKRYQKINLIINPRPTTNAVVIAASLDNPTQNSLLDLENQLAPIVKSTGCAVFISERDGTADEYTIHTWRFKP